ncbi:MAG: protein kinase [Gammaproteobacteria bacterium]|nr:protein kinase [Gammaproteobacteria bacterium]
MPKHLQSILREKVLVQRIGPNRQIVHIEVSVMDAFQISDMHAFFSYAERVIAYFKGKNPAKIERKIGIEGQTPTCSFIKQEGDIYAISRDVIGSGHFGRVRLALKINHPTDTNLYVIKVQAIKPNDAFHDNLIQTEAKIGGLIGYFLHPILQRTDVGKHHNNKYYAISLYGGITLTQWLKSKTCSDEVYLKIAIRVCEQVHALHEKGYAHGDLKPDNILINPKTHQVMLVDFGLITPLSLDSTLITMKGSLTALPFFPTDQVHTFNKRTLLCRMQSLGVVRLEALALMRLLDSPFSGSSAPPSLLSTYILDTALHGWMSTSTPEQVNSARIQTSLEVYTFLLLYFYESNCHSISTLTKETQQTIVDIHMDDNVTHEMKIKFIGMQIKPTNGIVKRNPLTRFSQSSLEGSTSASPLTQTPHSNRETPTASFILQQGSPSRFVMGGRVRPSSSSSLLFFETSIPRSKPSVTKRSVDDLLQEGSIRPY